MPYLKIQTNHTIDADRSADLIQSASRLVADGLGKPERYVMVALEPPVPMVFAGSPEPTVFMELKSIGLPESKTAQLSESLCQLINSELGVPADRVYIEFQDAPRKMWGWDSGTF
ncbi:MAG: phenylpyruvate tautomerase MIF-related protein [Gammaproteobacteria bacterium]|jgi:phenylpyruvate tautomerase